MTTGKAVVLESVEQPKGILVVEDDVALRFALAEWFRLLSYTVYEAATADEAVTLLSSPIVVDLVITDIDMPGTLNGLELVTFINGTGAATQAIIVSGHDQDARACGTHFFKKPYDLREISALIVRMLELDPPEAERE